MGEGSLSKGNWLTGKKTGNLLLVCSVPLTGWPWGTHNTHIHLQFKTLACTNIHTNTHLATWVQNRDFCLFQGETRLWRTLLGKCIRWILKKSSVMTWSYSCDQRKPEQVQHTKVMELPKPKPDLREPYCLLCASLPESLFLPSPQKTQMACWTIRAELARAMLLSAAGASLAQPLQPRPCANLISSSYLAPVTTWLLAIPPCSFSPCLV